MEVKRPGVIIKRGREKRKVNDEWRVKKERRKERKERREGQWEESRKGEGKKKKKSEE